jgi:hypothetical protein
MYMQDEDDEEDVDRILAEEVRLQAVPGGFALEDASDEPKLTEAAKAYWAAKEPERSPEVLLDEKMVCYLCEEQVEDDKDEECALESIVVCDVCSRAFHFLGLKKEGVDLEGCFDQDAEWLCGDCVDQLEQHLEAEKEKSLRSSRSGRAIHLSSRYR